MLPKLGLARMVNEEMIEASDLFVTVIMLTRTESMSCHVVILRYLLLCLCRNWHVAVAYLPNNKGALISHPDLVRKPTILKRC